MINVGGREPKEKRKCHGQAVGMGFFLGPWGHLKILMIDFLVFNE